MKKIPILFLPLFTISALAAEPPKKNAKRTCSPIITPSKDTKSTSDKKDETKK